MKSTCGTVHYSTHEGGDTERDDACFEVVDGVLFIRDNGIVGQPAVQAYAPSEWLSAWVDA